MVFSPSYMHYRLYYTDADYDFHLSQRANQPDILNETIRNLYASHGSDRCVNRIANWVCMYAFDATLPGREDVRVLHLNLHYKYIKHHIALKVTHIELLLFILKCPYLCMVYAQCSCCNCMMLLLEPDLHAAHYMIFGRIIIDFLSWLVTIIPLYFLFMLRLIWSRDREHKIRRSLKWMTSQQILKKLFIII